jgi:hypothetical protein
MIETLVEPKPASAGGPRNWLANVAIGEAHLAEWERYAKDSLVAYAERFGLGLVVFTDHLDERDDDRPHPAWEKLLVGRAFANVDPDAHGVLFLDTDVVANPFTGRNVFDVWDPQKVGMVSQRYQMPYEYFDTAKRICFLRNRFITADYPLNSSFLFDLEQVYGFEGFAEQPEECCTGFFVFSPKRHGEVLADIYDRYRNHDRESLALEQTHLNYYVQHNGLLQIMDYEFQVIWVYEMAQKYPFLYRPEFRGNDALVLECVGASLLSSTFLHFAGRWNESGTMNYAPEFLRGGWEKALPELADYLQSKVRGVARGMINPPDEHHTRNRPT